MSRMARILARRNRVVWDHPGLDKRLLPRPFSKPVSLGKHLDPLRMSITASAPSRPPSLLRIRAADARVPSPRMITHGSYPQRACPTTMDARVPSPRMNSYGSYPKRACPTTVDARVLSRMKSRPAVPGAEADACGYTPRKTSRAPAQDAAALAAEVALAHPCPFLPSHPDAPRGISHARPAIHPPGRCQGIRIPVVAGLVPALPDRQGVSHSRTKRK